MGKSIRKIVQIGECSGVILPKEYLERNDIERGDEIELVFNGIVKIKPIDEDKIRQELGGSEIGNE